MQVCTSLQTDDHASTPPLCFLQAGCPSCRPTNSVKALKALNSLSKTRKKPKQVSMYTVTIIKAHFQILDHCRYAQLTLCGNETFNRRLKMSHEGAAPVSLLDLLICFCRAHGRDKQTDRPRYMRSNRPHLYVCIAMRAKNYSERRNWRHQFRGQHEWNKARCKHVVVAVGNCTRAMCVRARRCQGSSTESARSPPQ